MKILSMIVNNFLSFGKTDFDFDHQGLVLVEGDNQDDESARSNGSGKSAMIDALVWCLFGTTLRGYENDEVVHRKAGEDCLVTVFVKDEHGHYAINRARRHSKFKNRLSVTNDDGEDISGPSNTETQEIVEKLLGCSKRTFLSSVVFGQDRAYRFSSLTDKDQKEILDEVLGVERFASACNSARAQVSVLGAAIETIDHDLERANDARQAAETEVAELDEKHEAFEGERARKIEDQRDKLVKAKEWVKKNTGDHTDKLNAALDKAQKIAVATEKEVATRNKEVTEAKIARAAVKSKLDEVRASVKKHEALAGACPTCGQRVDDTQHKRVLADFKKKLKHVCDVYEKADEVVSEFDSALDEAQRRLADARGSALAAQKTLNESIAETANAKVWKQRVLDHEERIAELEKETSPYAALAKKAEAKRAKHEAEVNLLTEQLAAEEAKLELVEFWVKAFGAKGLRSLLLDTSLPLLNEEAGRVSRAVTGGSISIEFSATSELKSGKSVDRFEVKVDNKHGAGSYQGNSAGEKAKVDLCVGLALQRLVASRSSASFNVAVFDEVFDSLDSAAHERVVEVLAGIDKESVFVVSHDEDLKAWFPASLRIVKKNGFSKVET